MISRPKAPRWRWARPSRRSRPRRSRTPRPNTSPPHAAEALSRAKAKKITVRQALREALAEEMRRDKIVFLLGEEIGEYQGAFKVTQGLLKEFGRRRVVDSRSSSTPSRAWASARPSRACGR